MNRNRRRMQVWNRVILETSLKPFRSACPDDIRAVCRHIWHAWTPLCDSAEAIGIMLWVGDGSEILEWSGDTNQPLEWGKYIGFCNQGVAPAVDVYHREWFANRPGTPVRDDMPEFTYGSLASIIAGFRATARELFGRDIQVGATFDPGPEFAESRFKYIDHPEILCERRLSTMRFVTCHAELNGDNECYAAYPEGIPDGTSLATFLGKQTAAFAHTLGYDYIWLSNGFGYTTESWVPTGEVIRPDSFHPERAAGIRGKTSRFWREFTAACPGLPVNVRGTNFSVGMDIGADGISHCDILRDGALELMPPNVPVLRAELLGIDLVAFLSRMAGSPGRRIMYRAYMNDPWFEHNPWYDIYDREPFETYTVMSAARLCGDGSVEAPNELNILTIDTERGEVPEDEALEVMPHYVRAAREKADGAGPVIWVYPFAGYDAVAKESPEKLESVCFHDHYMWRSVNGGAPIGMVCNGSDVVTLFESGTAPDAVYIAPAPLKNDAYSDALLAHAREGGRVIFYGPLAHAPADLCAALGVSREDPIEGDVTLEYALPDDLYDTAPCADRLLRHRASTCGGGIAATAPLADAGVRIAVTQGSARRAYCIVRRTEAGGTLAWIRGTVPFAWPDELPYLKIESDDFTQFHRPDTWLRHVIEECGFAVRHHRPDDAAEPVRMIIKRHRGAWYLAGSKPDTRVDMRIRTPDGAPAFTNYETPIINGFARDGFGKTIYNEIRFFVDMPDGTVCARSAPFGLEYAAAYELTGCVDARVTIYPDPDALKNGRVKVFRNLHDDIDGVPPVASTPDIGRGCIVVENHTGALYVKW